VKQALSFTYLLFLP